jgi:PPOX class probable F420-dependent enzyme
MTELTSFANLGPNPFIALTTYRKNGTPVMTPVWFVQQGSKLFVWTAADSGKAKRLKNNACVRLGPSNHSGKLLGDMQEGSARFVAEAEFAALEKAFKAKYGWQVLLFSLIWKIQGHPHTYIEIASSNTQVSPNLQGRPANLQ